MRPPPGVAAGFQLPRPGKVSRVSNAGLPANAARERLSAIPLVVANLTNSRREIAISRYLFGCAAIGMYRLAGDPLLPVRQPGAETVRVSITPPVQCRSAMDAGPGPGVTRVGHCLEPNGTGGGRNGVIPRLASSAMIAARASPPISS